MINHLLDRPLAKVLWDYNQLNQPIRRADFIFIMCSYNLDVADYAGILFMQKMGKHIAVSGGIAHLDDLLQTTWDDPEALVFKNRLIELGIKEKDITIEDKASNCGENVTFTKEILQKEKPDLATGLIVQKPYMERRSHATACKQWPEIEWQVTSPRISYDEYIEKFDEERLINIMVGDTQRIKEYADKGFQTRQEIPENVEEALQKLIDKDYTKHII